MDIYTPVDIYIDIDIDINLCMYTKCYTWSV